MQQFPKVETSSKKGKSTDKEVKGYPDGPTPPTTPTKPTTRISEGAVRDAAGLTAECTALDRAIARKSGSKRCADSDSTR
ncbi:hypothetical protein QTI33_09530 [Variovorax sp. J22P271]|nr:hypothetical protein [Variovorax sp. J22P271]